MIIDIRREMNDIEHEKYLSSLIMRQNESKLLSRLEDHVDDEYFLDLTCDLENTEYEYLEEFQHRVDECIHRLVGEDWQIVDSHCLNSSRIIWAEQQNIPYTIVYSVRYYDYFHLLFKKNNEYHSKLYEAKFHNEFNGGIFLLQNGWIKEAAHNEKKIKWALDELGDDFLYDRYVRVCYFRPEAAMAFKLRWT